MIYALKYLIIHNLGTINFLTYAVAHAISFQT